MPTIQAIPRVARKVPRDPYDEVNWAQDVADPNLGTGIIGARVEVGFCGANDTEDEDDWLFYMIETYTVYTNSHGRALKRTYAKPIYNMVWAFVLFSITHPDYHPYNNEDPLTFTGFGANFYLLDSNAGPNTSGGRRMGHVLRQPIYLLPLV